MSPLILHHYELSPYSQKVRAMLGYAQLAWQSALTTASPPRTVLTGLTAGYRKVPVLQIGADVFCDSKIIAEEIASLAQLPTLALSQCSSEAQALSVKAEGELFFACLVAGATPSLAVKAWQAMTILDMARFVADRVAVGRTSSVRMYSAKQSKSMVLAHVAHIESLLTAPYLFGNQPCHADFAVYHPLWFVHILAGSTLLHNYPKTCAWLARVHQFASTQRVDISVAQALQFATVAQPRAISASNGDAMLGHTVSISPKDYAKNASTGTLLSSNSNRYVIGIQHPVAGSVQVHFPSLGYRITAHA